MNSILGVSSLELHSSGTEPVTFFGAQFPLEGTSSDLGAEKTGMPPPPWRWSSVKSNYILQALTEVVND